METTAYYAFGGPIYLFVVALEWWVARRRGKRILSFAPAFGNLSAGLGAITVGLFLGPALILLYSWAYDTFRLVTWPAGSIVPWILGIMLADLGHYLHHRLDHAVAACWAVHGVHHQPEELNFTVAMRHAWFSDLYSFPFYAACPLLGVPVEAFFVGTTLLSFHALITHSAQYRFPSLGIFVTPQSHMLHHARNPEYLDRNFGAMLCVWDKLFGTHVSLSATPEFGCTRGYATHDGVRAQGVFWADLLDLARRARGWDRVRVFVRRPGWHPEGVEPAPIVAPPSTHSRGVRAYVALQFVLLLPFAHWVLILRDAHGWGVDLVGAAVILATLWTLGRLLDGRRHAWAVEGARVVLGGLGVAWVVGV